MRAPLERLERDRKWPEGALVRRELDDPLEAELALHRFDRPPRLVRNELGDRAAKERRAAHSVGVVPSELFLRQNINPAPAAATAATIAGLFGRFVSRSTPGTAVFAFFFAARLPTCHT